MDARRYALRNRNGDLAVAERREARRQGNREAYLARRREERNREMRARQQDGNPLYQLLEIDDLVSVRIRGDKWVPAKIKAVGICK